MKLNVQPTMTVATSRRTPTATQFRLPKHPPKQPLRVRLDASCKPRKLLLYEGWMAGFLRELRCFMRVFWNYVDRAAGGELCSFPHRRRWQVAWVLRFAQDDKCFVIAYATTTPAYPTTRFRSPEISPEVAYFTNSADRAPSWRAAVSIATDGPKPHMLMFCCVTTS